MLCIWHIEKNLVTNGAKHIKNKLSEHDIIAQWNQVIQLSSPSDFSASFSRFLSQSGAEFQKYMESQWLPVAEKYANAWTKLITHFGNQTTSQIKSGHDFIKSHLLGPNHSFTSVIKMITNTLEAQAHEISAHYHQQQINSLRNLAKIFENCHGRITHYALQKAQTNLNAISSLDKTSTCNGFHQKRTRIPCKHRLAELVDLGHLVEPEEFHPQWHIKLFLFPFFIP
jgi:hypothetical protein